MGKDYYKLLGVSKSASQEDIKKAYRKLALKWHPDRVTPDKKEEAQAQFQEISHAFEVLSDPEKKRIYDQVGEEGLNGGFPGGAGDESGAGPSFHFSQMPNGMRGGQSFHFSNADDIFRNFFGTSDAFAAEGVDIGGMGGFPFGAAFGGMPGGARMGGGSMPGGFSSRSPTSQPTQKAPPVNHNLNVTLEDLYTGITKRVRITKKIYDEASGRQTQVSNEKEIVVKQGWKDGTKITFEREGDEGPGLIPADIIFTIQTKPHDRFRREGDDLHYTCKLTLLEALSGTRKAVKSLDGRDIAIDTRNMSAENIKIIPGEGMINQRKGTRGDLRVTFVIDVTTIATDKKRRICEVLESHS
jgi:DnaJ homolog subfamily B member 4